MEYMKLVLGILTLISAIWLIVKNRKRTGILHLFLRGETMVAVLIGFYLTISGIIALLS